MSNKQNDIINEMIHENDESLYSGELSECCGAPLYANIDVCSDCKEHSGPQDKELIEEKYKLPSYN